MIFKGACSGLDLEEKCEESETICEAVFVTNKQTCGRHCKSLGLVCEDGWNHKSDTCAKDKDSALDRGCELSQYMQICRCMEGKLSINHFLFRIIFSMPLKFYLYKSEYF